MKSLFSCRSSLVLAGIFLFFGLLISGCSEPETSGNSGEDIGVDVGDAGVERGDTSDSGDQLDVEESGVDSGDVGDGSDVEDCEVCAAGESCEDDLGCISGICEDQICQPASCEDELQNGDESDVDCGGTDCPVCPEGGRCDVDGDCATGFCLDESCVEPFLTVWDSEVEEGVSDSDQIILPLVEDGSYDFRVLWGDGTESRITNWDQAEAMKTYSSPGTYTVAIAGELEGWRFQHDFVAPNSDAAKLLEIRQWGPLRLVNVADHEEDAAYFKGALNLEITAEDVLDLSGITNLSAAFQRCRNLGGAALAGWDVSEVVIMRRTFRGTPNLSEGIEEWDVSSVTDMREMLHATGYNGDITGWDVSSVTNMREMFWLAQNFNQDIGVWDVSAVTTMSTMFQSAYEFNGNIELWNVSSVENMAHLFAEATSFNRDISAWDVSSATIMRRMFRGAEIFNQDIGNWDVSSVTTMDSMFMEAASFDQDLSDWDISSATQMGGMFWDVALSTVHYDALLISFANQDVQRWVGFGGGNSQYSPGAAATARQKLIDEDDWLIYDGGPTL